MKQLILKIEPLLDDEERLIFNSFLLLILHY
jgi:hypothetical protein